MMDRFAYLRFIAHNFVGAMVYGFGAIVLGWTLGGPEALGGERLFAETVNPLIESRGTRAAVVIAALALALWWVSAIDRRADAIVKAVTGKSQSVMPALKLVFLGIGASLLCLLTLMTIWLVTGGWVGFRYIFQTVALALFGMASVGRVAEMGFRSGGGGSPAANRVAEHLADVFTVLENLFSFNPLGLAISLLGASIFLELGLDESNISFLLLFYLPLLNASVDALSWLVSVRLLAPLLSARAQRPGLATTWLPYASAFGVLALAMPMLKAVVLIAGAETYNAMVREDQLPWQMYAVAFGTSPCTAGLGVTVMLAMAALSPAVCFGILTLSTIWRSARWPIAVLERLKRLAHGPDAGPAHEPLQ